MCPLIDNKILKIEIGNSHAYERILGWGGLKNDDLQNHGLGNAYFHLRREIDTNIKQGKKHMWSYAKVLIKKRFVEKNVRQI